MPFRIWLNSRLGFTASGGGAAPVRARASPAQSSRGEAGRSAGHAARARPSEGAVEAPSEFYSEPISLQALYSGGSGVEPVATMSAKSVGCCMASFFLQRMKKYGRS